MPVVDSKFFKVQGSESVTVVGNKKANGMFVRNIFQEQRSNPNLGMFVFYKGMAVLKKKNNSPGHDSMTG